MAIQGISSSQNYFTPDDLSNVHKPEKSVEAPAPVRQESPKPKTQTVTMSTDRVDAEIKSLQSKGLNIAKAINASDDEDTRLSLEEQLRQIQNELRNKNNDAYRRQNADISLGVDVVA